jgi:transposase
VSKTCRVVIGMDPHKRSATIEVMAADEQVLGGGRFGTDPAGFGAMLAQAGQWPDRVQAAEGCEGIGKHLVLRLPGAGETVIDVPTKLSARMRVYATGQGRKTDDTDAHSIALVGVRMTGLRHVVNDESLEVLRLLVDRRLQTSAQFQQFPGKDARRDMPKPPPGAKELVWVTVTRR